MASPGPVPAESLCKVLSLASPSGDMSPPSDPNQVLWEHQQQPSPAQPLSPPSLTSHSIFTPGNHKEGIKMESCKEAAKQHTR